MREAIALEPTVEDHYLDLSLSCVRHDNHELGEEILDIGLLELPDSYRLSIQQGAIHERASKKQEAKQTFRRAIAAHPRHQLALAGLATTLLSDEKTPGCADSYYRLGKVLAETDEARATASFETAPRHDPTDEASKYQLARLNIKAGGRDEGRRLMAEVRQAKAEQLEKERKPRPGVRPRKPPEIVRSDPPQGVMKEPSGGLGV